MVAMRPIDHLRTGRLQSLPAAAPPAVEYPPAVTDDSILTAVRQLDTTRSSDEEAAWSVLRPLGSEVVPLLLEAFPSFRTWQGRTALVFHTIRYARESEHAFQIGLLGCRDRSYMVRYRACGLLAYSLRADALPHLEPLLNHRDRRTVEDASAAVDAIRSRNHHYFVDRDHSGRSFWAVNEGDR